MFATQSWLYPDMYLISPFHVASVLSEKQHHKTEYVTRTEWVSVANDYPIEAVNCYSIYSGVFIGDRPTTRYVTRSRGWRLFELQPAHPCHAFCNVGWSKFFYGWVGFKNPIPDTTTRRAFRVGDLHYPQSYKSGTIATIEEAKESAIRFAIDINSPLPSELPEALNPIPHQFIPPTPPTLEQETIHAINERNETEGRPL